MASAVLTPDYCVEGETLVLLDDTGNVIGEPYSLSPLQNPHEVAAWLWQLERERESPAG
jgi:hypothetical protein